MNKKFLLILFFGIFLINLNFASAVLTNATMLNDTFESGNLNLWTDNGATDWVLSITRSVSPTHSVEASKKTNDLLSDNMDMSDATEIYISFSYWITSIDPNDNVYLNYWDGTAYDQIDEIGDDAEGTWLTFSQTITDSQYFNNGFHIYIEGSSIDNRENLWIDDVLIKKQYSANEVPIVSNITSSHETIKGGEIITVYANTTTHGVNDTEQGTLYLYCDTSDVPTSLNTDCAGGSVTTDIDYPYVFTCLISTPLDDSSNTEYCRVYDGEDYSSAVNVTYLTDSSSPTTSVISVAGDSVASYFDISNNGRTDILVSGELNMSCRWSSSDLAYSAMTSVCPISESIANCSVNNVASQGFTTRYVACEDSLGNEQNSTTNLNVGFYLDYTAPVTTDNSNINIQAPPYIVTITESDNVDSDPATYYCTSSSVGCNPTTIIDNGGIVTYTSVNRGVNYLRYYSVDDAGISQTIVNKTININQLPIFNSAVDDAVIIASGATVNVSTVSSEPDAQQLTMYVCSSASATSAGCSDTEYCSASESANVSCTFSASSSSGIYNWYAYIFDDSDEAATANPNAGSYAVDATAPVITVINPENYANYTQTSVSFQIILNEVGNFAWYNFDSNLTNNVTMLNSSTTQWSATVSDLTLGLHNVTFYSNDSYGNVGVSSVIYFSRVSPADTTAPAITILSPQNASYKNPASTLINISADENLAWAGYQLNGGSIVDLGNSTATNWNIILSSLTQETKYNLTIYGNDTSNNQNNKTIIFYSDSLAPRYSSAQANPSPSNVSQEVNCSVTWTDIYNITTVKIAENSAGIYENHTIAFSGVSGSASYLISGSKLTNPGTYECIFYAEDFAGNSNVTSVSFDVNDVTVPVITAISPFNGTTYSVSSILASITISEDASSAWYSLDGEANVSMSNTSGTSWSFNLVGLLDAEHNITFYANDTSNNLGTFTTIYFTVNAIPDDTTPPAVIIISPGNATYNDPSSILVNVTSDENLAWVGYQLNGGSIVNLDNNTAINWNITLSLTNEAEYNLTIYANDTSDNQNNKSIVFYVDSLSPRFTNALASPSPANVSQAVNCSITLTDIYNITTVKISENSAGIYENHTIAFSGVSGVASYNIIGSKLTNTGTYECIFYAEDFAGNSNSTSVSFDINDVTSPLITVTSPSNGATYNQANLTVSITTNENISWAGYSLDGVANISMNEISPTSWDASLTGLSNGAYAIVFSANDSSNNIGASSTISFTIDVAAADTTSPVITINTLSNGTYYTSTTNDLNITTDETTNWAVYKINSGSLTDMSNTTDKKWNITLSSLGIESTNFLEVYANDSVNNTGNTNITFYVDTLVPRATNFSASPNPANVSQNVLCNAYIEDTFGLTSVKIEENASIPGVLVNHTISLSSTGWANYTISNVEKGTYTCRIYATDIAGNNNFSESTTFDVNDVIAPLIIINSPLNQTYSLTDILFSISLDEDASDAKYSLDGGLNNVSLSGSTQSWSDTVALGSNGGYSVTFYVNDSSNNIRENSVAFSVDSTLLDTVVPIITINTLVNGSYYASATKELNITTDEDASGAWYKLNSGSIIDMSNTTLRKWNSTLTGLGVESTNTLEVYANDSSSNLNTGNNNITFYADTLAPRITSVSASPNPANVSQNVICNAYIEDTFGLTSVKIEENASISGVFVNHTISLSSTGWANYTISNIEKGTYTCRIYATDIAGNNNFSESTTFDVNDVTAPIITINSPLNQTYSSDSIFIGITTNENVGSVVYSLDVGVTNVSLIGSGTSWSKTSVFLDGSHNITFYVNDSSNNLGYASTVFSVDTTSLDTTFPTITIWSPTNGTYDLDGAILLNISSDEALSWAGWQNGSDSIVDLGNVSTVNWNSTVVFSEGIYNLTFYANDSSSNQNQENSSVVFYVDLTNPSVDYFSCSDANDSGEVICFANVSDVIGLDYAIIGYNATGVFQNSSQISLSGLSDSLNYTIAAGNSSPPGFTTQIYLYDDSGRNNLTESDFVVISDDTFPLIYNVTYSPNTTTDLDPGVRVNINASIVEDYNISSVVFMYKNSSASSWTSIIMSNLTTINYGAETNTIYNASFVPQNETWYFQINATDAAGNQNIFSNYTLVVEDDISFLNSTTIPDTKSITYVQRSENNSLGILYLNNTGDGSLDFNISVVSTISSRFNINYTNDDNASYSISSGDNLSLAILVNTTDLTTNLFYYNLTIVSVLGARTYEKQLNIQTADGPYLVVTIPTYSALVTVGDSNVGYVAKLENFGTQDAQDSYLNWTLPSGFTITSGSENRNLGVIPIGGFGTNTIETSIGGSLGLVNIIATGSATSADSANDTKEITVSALAGTSAVPEVGSSGGGGGGSGFSKGGAESAVYSKTIEIVRGQEDSFEIVIENNFKNMSLQNLELELTGFLSQYISTSPIKIGKINPGESKSFLIKLKIPSYKESYEEHELKAVIKGRVVRSGENSEISYTETQNILLIIQEVSMKESSLSLAEAERAVEDMRKADFNIKDADGLLSLAKNKLYENRNKEAQVLAEEVIEIRDMAFGVDNLIRRVASAVQDPKKSFLLTGNVMNDFRGNDRNVTLKQLISANSLFASDDVSDMLNLAIASFERGDYVMAEERIMDARSLLLLERKGNFGLFFYLYWYFILLVIGFFIIFVFFGYKQYRKSSVTRRIEDINSEEENIRKLMQVSQRNYFLGKSSSGEYHSIMDQHQSKLVNIRKQRLTLRNKRIRMLKSVQIIQELKLERMQVESEIRKLQEIYYRDNKISESEYKAQFEILNERLAEIEGEKITLELLKGKNKNMNKQVVKKSLNKEVIKARKNVVGKGKARIMFLSIWGFLKRPFNRKENILDKKKKIRGVRKK